MNFIILLITFKHHRCHIVEVDLLITQTKFYIKCTQPKWYQLFTVTVSANTYKKSPIIISILQVLGLNSAYNMLNSLDVRVFSIPIYKYFIT